VNYDEFLESKQFKIESSGWNISHDDINSHLFPFQKDIVKWAVKKGRRAIGIELKESYFNVAVNNLNCASENKSLFVEKV
jgi:hypothetical protein